MNNEIYLIYEGAKAGQHLKNWFIGKERESLKSPFGKPKINLSRQRIMMNPKICFCVHHGFPRVLLFD